MGMTGPPKNRLDRVRSLFKYRPIENLLFYFSNNRKVNSFIGKLIPHNRLYPAGSMRNVCRQGIYYLLDISDYQNWLIYFGINEDRPENLYDLIETGDTVIDVGVNIGQTSMRMAKKTGETGLVIGFEPDRLNFSRAMENLKLNTFQCIRYFNYGLGSKKEQLYLKVNTPSNSGGNRIDRNQHQQPNVEIEKLDNVATLLNLKKVDVIKIDVEGFEMEVLKGAVNTLEQFKPKLYIELDDQNLKEQQMIPKDVIRFLEKLNYTIIDAKNKRLVTSASDFKNCHFDIICY